MAIEKMTEEVFMDRNISLLAEKDSGEILVSSKDLAEAIGIKMTSIRSLVFRNDYLNEPEFSFIAENFRGRPRFFTEDGVYEILMLMEGNERAKEFRRWLRKLVKDIRHGEAQVTNKSGQVVANAAIVNTQLQQIIGSLSTVQKLMAVQEERMDHHEKLMLKLAEKIDSIGGADSTVHLCQLERQNDNTQSILLSVMQMLQEMTAMEPLNEDDASSLLERPDDLDSWREQIESDFTALENQLTYRPYSAVLKMVRDMGVDTETIVKKVISISNDNTVNVIDAIGWFPEYRKLLEKAMTDYEAALLAEKSVAEENDAKPVPGFMRENHKQIWAELILPLARAKNDKSVAHSAVYRGVYRTMQKYYGVNWDQERKCFERTYSVKPTGIQEMVRKSSRLYDIMVQAVQYMLDSI